MKHSYKEKVKNCPECKTSTLERQLTIPTTIRYKGNNYPQKNRTKTGAVVTATIEDTKKEIKQQQADLKKRKV